MSKPLTLEAMQRALGCSRERAREVLAELGVYLAEPGETIDDVVRAYGLAYCTENTPGAIELRCAGRVYFATNKED